MRRPPVTAALTVSLALLLVVGAGAAPAGAAPAGATSRATATATAASADYDGTFDLATCTITGTEGDDTLVGTPGDDVICGLGGDDLIRALGGADTIVAGAGNDTVFGGAGDDLVLAGAGDDAVSGGAGDDILVGGSGADTVRGGAGDDLLEGRGESSPEGDDLEGEAGADSLVDGTSVKLTSWVLRTEVTYHLARGTKVEWFYVPAGSQCHSNPPANWVDVVGEGTPRAPYFTVLSQDPADSCFWQPTYGTWQVRVASSATGSIYIEVGGPTVLDMSEASCHDFQWLPCTTRGTAITLG